MVARGSNGVLEIGGVLNGAFDLESNEGWRGVTDGRDSDADCPGRAGSVDRREATGGRNAAAARLGKAGSANSIQATGVDLGMRDIVGN